MAVNYREKLAHLLMMLIILSVAGAACWYFRNVLIYVVMALVVTLLALPFRRMYDKIRFGKYKNPDWLSAVMSIITEFIVVVGLMYLLVPMMNDVARDISRANISDVAKAVSVPLSSINEVVGGVMSAIDKDFRVETYVLGKIQNLMDAGALSSALTSVTSFFIDMGVAVFAVIFIAFFFIKTPSLFENIILAVVKDGAEEKVHKSIHEIGRLLTRYFKGISLEVLGVWLINFIGLWAIARMGFKYSISIAFLAGLLNVIPYIGPLIGYVLSISLCLIIHYTTGGMYGLDVNIIPFTLIILAIGVFTQFVDNYIFQPVIYSNSVKAHPLEIFIVFLIAGQMGGMFGMIIAIPGYTVLRVVAREFFGDIKAIRKLTGSTE